MPAPDQEETASESLAPTSRRTFLGLAAAAGGASLGAALVVAEGSDGESLTLLASPGQHNAVRAAADRLHEIRSSTRISLDIVETAGGIELFTAGEVDVVAADRPLLPAERSCAGEHGVDQQVEEVPTDVTTLSRPEPSWTDPLRPERIAKTWNADGSVSTWAEVVSDDGGPEGSLPASGSATASVDSDESALVRGVRAAQYSTGRGGIGYYEPEWEWLGSDVDATGDQAAPETQVVRLAYLGVDRASLRTPVVEDVVRVFDEVSTDRVGEVPFFDDPYGVTAA